jgi:exopolysaccharide biosynthesis polyprenyl glycosylphosphotransferase
VSARPFRLLVLQPYLVPTNLYDSPEQPGAYYSASAIPLDPVTLDGYGPAGGSTALAPPLVEGLGHGVVTRPARRSARGWERVLHGPRWGIACALGDVVMLVSVVAVVHAAAAPSASTPLAGLVWAFPPLVMVLLAQRGSYRDRIELRWLDTVAGVIRATSIAAMFLLAVMAASAGDPAIDPLVITWLAATVAIGAGRSALVFVERSARARQIISAPTIILGSGRVAARVERRLHNHPELGLRPVGFVDDVPAPDEFGRMGPLLGPLDRLPDVIRSTGAEHVVVAFMSARGADAALREVVRDCRRLGVRITVVPRLFEVFTQTSRLEHLGALPVVTVDPSDPVGWRFKTKYAFDRLLAGALLVLMAPVMLALALAVKLSSPGPVLLRQKRVGLDGRRFELLKFRSMRLAPAGAAGVDLWDGEGEVGHEDDVAPGGIEGEDRRTLVGRVLRGTSLDELPQLLNVLKGDMSLVGPRPERPEFVELFDHRVIRYSDRRRVKPGMTGWAQVHGLRGKTSLADRVEWDNFYIENWSPRLDARILLMTVIAMFRAGE